MPADSYDTVMAHIRCPECDGEGVILGGSTKTDHQGKMIQIVRGVCPTCGGNGINPDLIFVNAFTFSESHTPGQRHIVVPLEAE